jgi:hypothetical protein
MFDAGKNRTHQNETHIKKGRMKPAPLVVKLAF